MTYQRDRKSRLPSVNVRFGTRSNRWKDRRSRSQTVEILEARQVLATFAVTSLDALGEGSLRRAILLANQSEAMDAITFEVGGTIRTRRVELHHCRRLLGAWSRIVRDDRAGVSC